MVAANIKAVTKGKKAQAKEEGSPQWQQGVRPVNQKNGLDTKDRTNHIN